MGYAKSYPLEVAFLDSENMAAAEVFEYHYKQQPLSDVRSIQQNAAILDWPGLS